MRAVSAVALSAAFACLAFWPVSLPARRSPAAVRLPANDRVDPYQYDPPLGARDTSALIDLRNFTFLASAAACDAPGPAYVALVHSAPGHRRRRDAVRRTWGRHAPRLVFLVGKTEDAAAADDLDEEVARYGDIVQGNFVDSYRNLTYKHVMGLKWAAYRCPSARYVVKVDDDVFVNTPRLRRFLPPRGVRRLVLCNVQERRVVKRSYRSKWHVAPAEYRDRSYPPHCAGWAVIYSRDAARRLYRAAQRRPYFWVDDVHVTGTLAALSDLTHTDVASLSASEDQVGEWLQRREVPEDFIFAMTTWENFQLLWGLLQEEVTPRRPLSQRGIADC